MTYMISDCDFLGKILLPEGFWTPGIKELNHGVSQLLPIYRGSFTLSGTTVCLSGSLRLSVPSLWLSV